MLKIQMQVSGKTGEYLLFLEKESFSLLRADIYYKTKVTVYNAMQHYKKSSTKTCFACM